MSHVQAPDAVDVFQRITTSYHIVSDKEKLQAYLDLYRLRCYMTQLTPSHDSVLNRHYAFTVDKSKSAKGSKSVDAQALQTCLPRLSV